MSDATKAVFLSYASQDAEAARKICEALRAAGVEVWFDQSELVGGDAWDQKIRRQIKECALLIPIISGNTQSRTEGYFRLEWRLADQRTHLMGRNKAFLLPVSIDGTTDADADVPDSFSAVQWTKAPGGEVPPAFCTRVKKLLDGQSVGGALRPDTVESSGRKAPPTKSQPKRWLAPVIAGVVIAAIALAISRPWEKKVPTPAVPAATSEIEKVRARIVPDRWQKGDFETVSATLDRLIQANPEDAEAWALRSIINSLQVLRLLDPGTKPLEAGKTAAERALRLAPDLPLGHLALGLHLIANVSRGGDPRAARDPIDRAVVALPPDALTRYAQLVSYWLGYDMENTQRFAHAWLEAEPQATYPAWLLGACNIAMRRADEAEQWAERAASDPDITGVRALMNLMDVRFYLRADLAGVHAAAERIPLRFRTNTRVIYWLWLLAMAEKRWDDALQLLAQVPDSMLFDVAYNGPKALLIGLTHQRAGRTEAAAAQFREAERLLRENLATDPDNEELRATLAFTLASAGRADEARAELSLVEPIFRHRAPNVYRGRSVKVIAQTYAALNDAKELAFWLRKLLAETSGTPYTPASLRLDPRYNEHLDSPEISALLKEFASLDQPAKPSTSSFAKASEDREQKTGIGLPVDQKSVAVLAFANLSDDKNNEYFSDGISEELLNVLAKIPGLKVAARTSAFYFKGKEVPVPEIAKQLGVAYVVEGSVRKAGDKVRITAQLIKAADGFHVWSDTFTRDMKDIFAVQDEIAGLIAKNLELKMGMVAARPTVDLEAYQEYLAGRALFAKASNDDLRTAVGHFEKALAIEPKFTAAWVQLASVHTQLGRWGGTSTLQAWPAARAAIDHAVALEPDSPDVLLALGWILRTGEWNWRGAERAYRRALELRPNHADTLSAAAVLLFNLGQKEEALTLGRRGVQLDPLNAATQIDLSLVFHFSQEWAEQEKLVRRAIQLAPSGVSYHGLLAFSLAEQRRFAEAEAEAHVETDDVGRFYALGIIAARQAQGEAARGYRRQLEELSRARGDTADLQLGIADISALLADKDQAFAALEKTVSTRDPAVAWLRNDFYLRPLHSDPRWDALLRKVGLADEQLK